MGGTSGDIKISFGDRTHPRDLIKNLKRKKKYLKLALKGKFSGFTDAEKEYYKSLQPEQIKDIIYQYDQRIRGLKKGLAGQGKETSNLTLDRLRSGQSAYDYSNQYVPPSMNPVVKQDKTEANNKKDSEDR